MAQLDWIEYITLPADDFVPLSDWGGDHWSTFAYLETRAVDYKGVIDNRHMRCNARLHRELANLGRVGGFVLDGSDHPTRARGREIITHDDWSCLEDMVYEGLLRAWFAVRDHQAMFGGNVARIELTPLGIEIAAKLRAHKISGGSFATFEFVIEKVQE